MIITDVPRAKAQSILCIGRAFAGLDTQPAESNKTDKSKLDLWSYLNVALCIYKQQYVAITKAISFNAILHSAI